jgi:hypothetical protein
MADWLFPAPLTVGQAEPDLTEAGYALEDLAHEIYCAETAVPEDNQEAAILAARAAVFAAFAKAYGRGGVVR